MRLLVALAILGIAAVAAEEEKDISHGFGTDIEWVSFEEAEALGKEQNKPVFLLIHKTWCGACNALKKNIKASNKRDEFVKLSRKFVMVNLEDDEEPEDEKYAPDGAYIPRLMFLDKTGELLAVDNKKNYANNAYYFPQAVDVINAMKRALKEFGAKEEPQAKDEKEEKSDKEEASVEKKEEDEKKKEKKTDKKTDEKKVDEKKEKKEKKEDKKSSEKTKEKKEEKKEKKEKKEEKKEDKKKEEKKEKKEKKEDKKKDDKKEKKEEKKKEEKKKEKKEDKKSAEKTKKEKDDKKKEEKKSKKDSKKTEL